MVVVVPKKNKVYERRGDACGMRDDETSVYENAQRGHSARVEPKRSSRRTALANTLGGTSTKVNHQSGRRDVLQLRAPPHVQSKMRAAGVPIPVQIRNMATRHGLQNRNGKQRREPNHTPDQRDPRPALKRIDERRCQLRILP